MPRHVVTVPINTKKNVECRHSLFKKIFRDDVSFGLLKAETLVEMFGSDFISGSISTNVIGLTSADRPLAFKRASLLSFIVSIRAFLLLL